MCAVYQATLLSTIDLYDSIRTDNVICQDKRYFLKMVIPLRKALEYLIYKGSVFVIINIEIGRRIIH